jgi:O-antigen/teichoic acid export membrane protein
MLFFTLIETFLAASWVISRSEGVKVGWRFVSYRKLTELYSFGINSVLLMSADRIQRMSMPVVISHLLNVSQVVFYSIPRRLIEYGQSFGVAMGFPTIAYFSSVEAQNRSVRQAWLEVSRWMQAFSLAIPVFALVFGSRFIELWIGPDYGVQARWIVVFLSIALFVEGIAPNSARLLIGTGNHGLPARILNIISIACVLMSCTVAPHAGLNGIAFVLMASNIISSVTLLVFACRVAGISVLEHLRLTVARAVLPLCSLATFLFCINYAKPPESLGRMAVYVATAGIMYFGMIFVCVLTHEERSAVRQRIPFVNHRQIT